MTILLSDCFSLVIIISLFLPPAYVVRGKVIFILGNVCLFTIAGGEGTPYQVWEGYPTPGLDGGVSHPWSGWWGVPHPRSGWWGGTPFQFWTGGYLFPGLDRGYPIPGLVGGCTPNHDWMGYTPTMTGWGTPPSLDGIPPPPGIASICYVVGAVADPGFPRGGGANPKGEVPAYYLANFSRKLHENEEIWGPEGGHTSLTPPPPLDLPLGRYASCIHAGGLSC